MKKWIALVLTALMLCAAFGCTCYRLEIRGCGGEPTEPSTAVEAENPPAQASAQTAAETPEAVPVEQESAQPAETPEESAQPAETPEESGNESPEVTPEITAEPAPVQPVEEKGAWLLMKRTEYDSDGDILSKLEYEYDDNGNMTVSETFYAEDNSHERYEYTYDENGYLIQEKDYDLKKNKLEMWFDYEYDADGNQTKYTRTFP
ncbi:MAG: hypothetical protein IKI52_07225, partial [Clostridia bacterium]|nr:hypothetical protein [Clostridia bacterium]